MYQRTPRIAMLAVLLLVGFLGAQFHFCTDLSAAPASSHFCPVCSAASSAVVVHSLSIAPLPTANRLEMRGFRLVVSIHIPRSISPRAPPTFGSIS
jgi:hypothetical protein